MIGLIEAAEHNTEEGRDGSKDKGLKESGECRRRCSCTEQNDKSP